MALTLNVDTDWSISLEEYVDYVARNVECDDPDSVLASAPMLRALANNPTFMAKLLNDQISRWTEFQEINGYSAQTLLLATGPGFAVRANVWEPPTTKVADREWQNEFYYYLIPHDHNFSFLTVGYLGPGYATTIYECDPGTIAGYSGEPVDLTLSERTTLPPGKVMYYRAGSDIHTQEHPTAFSMSINLMIVAKADLARDQYYYDVENRRIATVAPGGYNGSRVMTCHLARYLGDGTTQGHLEALSQAHPAPRVRLAAAESLAILAPTEATSLWERATADPHPLVAATARAFLDGSRAGIEDLGPILTVKEITRRRSAG